MPRILWLIHGAAVLRHWAVTCIYASCISRHVWRAYTVGCAEMSVSHGDNWKGQQAKLIVQLRQGCACMYMESAKTKMHCFVSCLQTQARLSYHALLIWQSVQEAGGEHKYCLGWLLKTRDKPLIHGVLFLWKSPGGSCISSALPKPQSALCLLQALLFVAMSVMVALKEPHIWDCQLIGQTSAFWLFSQRSSTYVATKGSMRNHFCFTACLCHGAVWQGYEGSVFTATEATLF